MEYRNKILNLFKNGYLTTKDVNDNNIPRTNLTKLIKKITNMQKNIEFADTIKAIKIIGEIIVPVAT